MSKTTTRKPATKTPVFEVCKDGRKWNLTENGKVIESFTTKTAALAEMAACQADTAVTVEPAPKAPKAGRPRQSKADVAEQLAGQAYNALEQFGDDFASMDRIEVLKIAKAEAAADKAWKLAGMIGDRPQRPATDWLANPSRPKARKAKGEPRTTVSEADLLDAVRSAFGGDAKANTQSVAAAVRAAGVKVGGARMSAAISAVRKEVKAG